MASCKAIILDAISQATHLWQARLDVIAVLLATRSYRETMFRLKQVTGFGVTGFMAKEVMEELVPWLPAEFFLDRDAYFPCGHGPRRSLVLLEQASTGELSLSFQF